MEGITTVLFDFQISPPPQFFVCFHTACGLSQKNYTGKARKAILKAKPKGPGLESVVFLDKIDSENNQKTEGADWADLIVEGDCFSAGLLKTA